MQCAEEGGTHSTMNTTKNLASESSPRKLIDGVKTRFYSHIMKAALSEEGKAGGLGPAADAVIAATAP